MPTADRVKDTTTSTGTGAITVANSAPTGYQTFASAYGANSTSVEYSIVGGAEWENVRGIFNGTTGLTRESVISSSNAGALVDFSAGTKDVFIALTTTAAAAGRIGRSLALARGQAMP